MLGSITGTLGSGKTLFMVQRALLNPDKDVYANFHINLPNCTYINVGDMEDIKNGILLLDEGYLWIDSRRSTTGQNRKLSYEIFKSRKKKLDIWVTTQLHGAIDKRFRFLEDIHVTALGFSNKKYEYRFYEYYMTGFGSGIKKWVIPEKYAEKFLFPIYDTDEYPEDEEETEKDLNKTVTYHADQLKAMYELKKITKGVVKDYLLEKGEEIRLSDPIYNRIKRLSL